MATRTYRGREIAEVMSEIKQNHGEDAVILSTRELGQKLIEVQVGFESEQPAAGEAAGFTGVEMQGKMPILETSEPSPRLTPSLLSSLLKDQGISEELYPKIVGEFEGIEIRPKKITTALSAGLSKAFQLDPRLPGRSRAVAFLGATGVGKTTTIAKLAARMRMAFDINIALVSADCYRVGAGFHLQSYASLIKIPFRALDPRFSISSQLMTALAEFEGYDLILIDTAGFSPRNQEHMRQLAKDFDGFPDIERILVLPAPSNNRDLYAAVDGFGQVGIDRTVITKIDETGYLGPALNSAYRCGKPLAFLTTGQRVPEDIEPASYKRLAWMLKRTLH
ncbi:MAG: hypothetical protein J5J00_05815 [Deltaproteobacteria bacterium]|nr:hypothetical protein [Deltaproteobacteria bacterium]